MLPLRNNQLPRSRPSKKIPGWEVSEPLNTAQLPASWAGMASACAPGRIWVCSCLSLRNRARKCFFPDSDMQKDGDNRVIFSGNGKLPGQHVATWHIFTGKRRGAGSRGSQAPAPVAAAHRATRGWAQLRAGGLALPRPPELPQIDTASSPLSEAQPALP